MRRPRGVDALLPAGAVAAVLAVLAALVLPTHAAEPAIVFVDLTLIGALTYMFHRTARVPGLPPPTARFWAGMVYAMLVYTLGMAVDFTALLVTAVSGRAVPMLGTELVYPVAGLFIMYAVFRYPTVAHTRSERLRIGLDAGIVLVGVASFVWYFTVSRRWSPGHGWLSLSETLALPVVVVVAGFGVLRVAFFGTRLLTRPTLACYAACIALTGFATTLPGRPGAVSLGSTTLLLLAQLSSLAGALLQYHSSLSGTTPPQGAARRPFSVVPYGASAAAFGLLVTVVGPGLDWRRWGVLAGTGILLAMVTTRQLTALRENGQLLAQNRLLTERLQHQAWHDELTGLANRAYLGRHVEEAIERYTTTGTDTALLLIDLDGFKGVNDTLGHEVGDRLLCEVADRLGSVAHDGIVCRLGGDEFVVLAPLDDQDLAERLVRAISAPAVIGAHTTRVGASIGVTFVSHAPTGIADLLRRADAAMYAVKSAGKNNWRLSEPDKAPHLTLTQ
ncbi:GGDEF domain-containing protein [Dactylosporangium sp. NPDC005555]|uniref:GGDEF domain-containing protein n=1 Tax=Dactylosporangium sp. NPDC005555 TaxID=3154889 RepID=UPI0033B625D0